MSATNGSGVGRAGTGKRASHGGQVSIDDDHTQAPNLIVGFTVQSMVASNNNSTLSANGKNTSLYQMIV